jgi:hypothetical protein
LPLQNQIESIFTIVGMVLCLGGWVVFYWGTRLSGIGLGLGLGYVFGEILSRVIALEATQQDMLVLICSVVGAVAGYLFIRAVTRLAFFISGLLFGAMIGRLIALFVVSRQVGAVFAWDTQAITIVLVTAVVTGLLAMFLQRHLVIVITSFIGANYLVVGVAYLNQMPVPAMLAVFILAIVWQGFLVKGLFPGSRRRHKAPAD